MSFFPARCNYPRRLENMAGTNRRPPLAPAVTCTFVAGLVFALVCRSPSGGYADLCPTRTRVVEYLLSLSSVPHLLRRPAVRSVGSLQRSRREPPELRSRVRPRSFSQRGLGLLVVTSYGRARGGSSNNSHRQQASNWSVICSRCLYSISRRPLFVRALCRSVSFVCFLNRRYLPDCGSII